MARIYYGNQSPIGRRINRKAARGTGTLADDRRRGGGREERRPRQARRHRDFSSRDSREICGDARFTSAVRTAGDPKRFSAASAPRCASWTRRCRSRRFEPWTKCWPRRKSRPRFLTTLLGLFSSTALVLAAVGLYGVISYSVTRRTTEFGIRMAMGASAGDVLGLVLGQGLRLALAGVAAGAIGALALTRLIRGLLFGVSAFDPMTFAAMACAAHRGDRCSRAWCRRGGQPRWIRWSLCGMSEGATKGHEILW